MHVIRIVKGSNLSVCILFEDAFLHVIPKQLHFSEVAALGTLISLAVTYHRSATVVLHKAIVRTK